ncbi:MAG: hypothetical protein ACI9OE_001090 [Mariniflexile sp.]|jgi:hypothetical protein
MTEVNNKTSSKPKKSQTLVWLFFIKITQEHVFKE